MLVVHMESILHIHHLTDSSSIVDFVNHLGKYSSQPRVKQVGKGQITSCFPSKTSTSSFRYLIPLATLARELPFGTLEAVVTVDVVGDKLKAI